MDDENIPSEDVSPETGAEIVTDESNALVREPDDSALFYFENDTIENVVSMLGTESQARLSSFLRKKVPIKFNSINTCLFDDIEHDYNRLLMLNFRILPFEKYGLITFDFIFLHSVINLLYGGTIGNNESIMRGLGKSGLKIAGKVSEIFLGVLAEAMSEYLKTPISMSEASNHLGAVFKQEKYDKCYNVSFCVYFDALSCNVNFLIPERLFRNSDVEEAEDASALPEPSLPEAAPVDAPIFDDRARNDLIDSNVTVSIALPPITLKLGDVVNLKSGDIIPIGDPTRVLVRLNDKTLYKGSAGQSNQRRAVKITEKLVHGA